MSNNACCCDFFQLDGSCIKKDEMNGLELIATCSSLSTHLNSVIASCTNLTTTEDLVCWIQDCPNKEEGRDIIPYYVFIILGFLCCVGAVEEPSFDVFATTVQGYGWRLQMAYYFFLLASVMRAYKTSLIVWGSIVIVPYLNFVTSSLALNLTPRRNPASGRFVVTNFLESYPQNESSRRIQLGFGKLKKTIDLPTPEALFPIPEPTDDDVIVPCATSTHDKSVENKKEIADLKPEHKEVTDEQIGTISANDAPIAKKDEQKVASYTAEDVFLNLNISIARVFATFACQGLLLIMYGYLIVTGDRPDFTKLQTFFFYLLGAAIQMVKADGTTNKDLKEYIESCNGMAYVMGLSVEESNDFKRAFEFYFRMYTGLLINHLGMDMLLLLLPLQLAQSENTMEFVLNAVAAYFIVELDNLRNEVKFFKPDSNQQPETKVEDISDLMTEGRTAMMCQVSVTRNNSSAKLLSEQENSHAKNGEVNNLSPLHSPRVLAQDDVESSGDVSSIIVPPTSDKDEQEPLVDV